MKKIKVLNYRVIIEQDEDGMYVASVPSIQGCYTEGKTYEEVLKNIKDVIDLHLSVRKDIRVKDDSKMDWVGVKEMKIQYPYGAYAGI